MKLYHIKAANTQTLLAAYWSDDPAHARTIERCSNEPGVYDVIEIPRSEAPQSYAQREVRNFTMMHSRPYWPQRGCVEAETFHYAHRHPKNWELIRYFDSKEKYHRGVWTEMKPGRYIKRYYPSYNDAQISAQYRAEFGPIELKFARTAKEIEQVYLAGPASCMKHEHSRYPARPPVHPTAAYGDSDLCVAYTERNGRPNSRAVAWPERKLYGRVYGDAEVLEPLLKEAGYSRFEKDVGFIGAKLTYVPYKLGFVFPYIDGNTHALINKEAKTIEICDPKAPGAVHVQMPNGAFGMGRVCERSGTEYPDYELVQVWTGDRLDRYSFWHRETYSDEITTCVPTGYFVEKKHTVEVEGETWHKAQAKNGAMVCCGNGKYYKSTNGTKLAKGWFSHEFLLTRVRDKMGEKEAA